MQQENATHTRDEKGRFMTGNDFARKTEKTVKTKNKPSVKESLHHILFELNVPASIAQPFRKLYSRKPNNYMDKIHGVVMRKSIKGNNKAINLLFRGMEIFGQELNHKEATTAERKRNTINVLLSRPIETLNLPPCNNPKTETDSDSE